MASSARRGEISRDRRQGLTTHALAAGLSVASNPLAVGGTTAFLVAFTFVSANALWYQPHAHMGAFLSTRGEVVDEVASEPRRIRIEREADIPRPAPADPQTREVQAALRDLDLYAGPVDGLMGPQTRAAITNYRRIAGIGSAGTIDASLLSRLRDTATEETLPDVTAAIPAAPRAQADASNEPAAPVPVAAPAPDARIVHIQAGLRAFGNDGIDLDGVAGEKTRAAIREFQSLFGLPVTGEPDGALLAKMREVGLTN